MKMTQVPLRCHYDRGRGRPHSRRARTRVDHGVQIDGRGKWCVVSDRWRPRHAWTLSVGRSEWYWYQIRIRHCCPCFNRAIYLAVVLFVDHPCCHDGSAQAQGRVQLWPELVGHTCRSVSAKPYWSRETKGILIISLAKPFSFLLQGG
jgi:hypothetical protein